MRRPTDADLMREALDAPFEHGTGCVTHFDVYETAFGYNSARIMVDARLTKPPSVLGDMGPRRYSRQVSICAGDRRRARHGTDRHTSRGPQPPGAPRMTGALTAGTATELLDVADWLARGYSGTAPATASELWEGTWSRHPASRRAPATPGPHTWPCPPPDSKLLCNCAEWPAHRALTRCCATCRLAPGAPCPDSVAQ